MDQSEVESQAVRALRTGRPEGLQELIRIYELPALRLAFSITGDRQLAEDVVSEAFVRLWKAAKRYDPNRPFGPWFYRIVANRAVTASGRTGRWSLSGLLPTALRDAADPGPGPEELAIRKDEQSVISAALRLLPPQQRAAVFLRYYLDMSEPQIAEVLGRPLGSVKSGLHLARTRLKQELRARGAREPRLSGRRRYFVSYTDSFDRSIGVALAGYAEQAFPAEIGLWPRVEAAIAVRRRRSWRRAVGLALVVLALSILAVSPARTFAGDTLQRLHGPHAPVDHGQHFPVDPHHAP